MKFIAKNFGAILIILMLIIGFMELQHGMYDEALDMFVFAFMAGLSEHWYAEYIKYRDRFYSLLEDKMDYDAWAKMNK